MNNYTYQNTLVSKKQLKQILSWSFTKYGSVQACFLADELKYLGFKYATQAGISISIEDLRVPYIKNQMLQKANKEILNGEKICLRGKITNVERFQKIIDTWHITSELLKDEVVSYFKNYDPLNSVYMMAFSGARGNLSQVRQLVGMRGLMSDPSGEIMNLPIKKNFREGLTITDYLMSGYGARKGIVDTALKTANSGYLTRRLIDVAQDIIIREKDCLTTSSFLLHDREKTSQSIESFYDQVLGRLINKPIYDPKTNKLIAEVNTQITPNLIRTFRQKKIDKFYIRSPLTCCLYRSICQKCYGWNLARENLIDIGEAVGILAGQSIGEPGTQLTMRTFHTGGIFTSATSQQLITPINGWIKFSKFLKTSIVRTNRGENVLLTENSGSLLILSDEKNKDNVQIELPRNTILFGKNKQYIKHKTVIGQLAGTVKQTRTEIKHILSDISGEVFIPKLQRKRNLTTINKLLWILSGQVYQAPLNSFLNFYTDYKIEKNNYIFRTKIINKRPGLIKLSHTSPLLSQQTIEIINNLYCLRNSNLCKLTSNVNQKGYLITINNLKYFINLKLRNSKLVIPTLPNLNFADLATNKFLTLTGGTPYYTQEINRNKWTLSTQEIHYYEGLKKINYHSVIWLAEETYIIKDAINGLYKQLLVKNNSIVSKNTNITAGTFSKNSGMIIMKEKKDNIQEIMIKPGYCNLIDESGIRYTLNTKNIQNIKDFDNKVFYPGELILNKFKISVPCITEIIFVDSSQDWCLQDYFKNINLSTTTKTDSDLLIHILIRPLEVYEIPLPKPIKQVFGSQLDSRFLITSQINYSYNSGQKVIDHTNLHLITQSLNLELTNFLNKKDQLELEVVTDLEKNHSNFIISEKFDLTQYTPAHLRYTDIQSCLIIQNNQFVNSYTTLAYLEAITDKSLELVKLKSKSEQKKQIFLISNDDCIVIPKSKVKNKTINNLVINEVDVKETGKIIIDNNKILTIQKGRPYFFPNCKNEDFVDKTNLQYKLVAQNSLPFNYPLYRQKSINIHYYDITNKLIPIKTKTSKTVEFAFSKMIIKNRGNVYITGIPIFLREVLINRKRPKKTLLSTLKQKPISSRRFPVSVSSYISVKDIFVMFMQNSELINNQIKIETNTKPEFASLLLVEYPFKPIGIHSVTEDFLEQEVNSVYCKNGEFIENGQTIGLLNFEKEITGDIVQGLPRIEELLEARKKKKLSKRIPKNQKKSLLIRKTSLDPTFEFRKLGTTIKENEKINPHNLLKVYFNYYAKAKTLIVHNQISQLFRLTNAYEASYRSFKKVQSLILNSVQTVYQSQGVTIADKHLEIIIKQMTAKVQITSAGDTPLLPHEVIDLYHIKYINEVIQYENRQPAFYVPLLLGVTKASLNNPSFISAASFQETTRVLTKAAIEGKRDWLRGLKENIVIGQLIPAGTGSKTYSRFFKKPASISETLKVKPQIIKNV